ncbi:Pyruvate phosphate dikinase, PEP/pyruvate-binding protein [Corchorus olitorius]|uniref:Pyruvate phosphate dikinase, PEP/pyruvate-binding protein n=1 Tax=Corchorus olitorius TaxID=93759 RepID=A0A1R3GHJ0_9ROSI|nr:Pyruvate phosphate dikinase, PEP/pyruvate-binding protein [Corchorus olitorius]
MATSSSAQVPRVLHFQLVDGMQLQINVSGCSTGRNARVELQLRNCTRTWFLHWGFIYRGNPNWYIPSEHSSGEKSYKQGALLTPFVKHGEIYIVNIELRDPKIHAIEFVLKDGSHDRWLKLNHGNFRVEIPEFDASASLPSIPKDLIDRKAYLIWESRGRHQSTSEQQKQDYAAALTELQNQLSQGISLNELQHLYTNASTKTKSQHDVEPSRYGTPSSYHRRHDVEKWLQRGQDNRTGQPSSTLMDLVEKSVGGNNVVSRQHYRVGNCDIVVLSKVVTGNYHLMVALNLKSSAVLHWGVSKSSAGEWLAPPADMLPEKSKMVVGACQTYFTDISTVEGSFQLVDINLQQRKFVGIQFVIWSSGSWTKNNGANFFVALQPVQPSGKADGYRKGIVKWLLDEISLKEKEAERSLMHRFNIATELTERCKVEGELGLIGILVWMRFMMCRHLTWNKNYNVKPREISEAQDRFTNLLQRIFLEQPNDREIVRLIMSFVGRGGHGDVGQRIRDEILMIQRNNGCGSGMMEEWHQKLHNNSSPDDVVICEALLNYLRCGFKLDVYWKTLNAHGLTKEKLASYDRPIVSEPHFRMDAKEGLIRDLTMYLKTLKAVHSGAELESAIESCLASSSKNQDFTRADRNDTIGCLSLKLQDSLNFVKLHINDENVGPLMEKLLESRIDIRPLLLTRHRLAKELLFLDLALASAVRTTMERGLTKLNFSYPPEIMFFISLVLENLCLSMVKNEDLIYCTKDWYRISGSYKPGDVQWALQTKAILERLQLALADMSLNFQNMIQPSAEYLGKLLGIGKAAIDTFTEELIRAGSAAVLSMLINRFDPELRKVANLGCWQVISPVEVCGFVTSVSDLISVQNKVYRKPTVIIATKVTGEEEIPDGVVAVLTSDMPDVLSHVSIRARNSKICFATCFDQNTFRNLKLKEGRAVSIQLKSSNLIVSDISGSSLSLSSIVASSIPRSITLKRKTFCGRYALSLEEFTTEMVGAKSCNIKFLRGRVPSWIRIPMSVAIPFGAFETVLTQDINKDLANKITFLRKLVHGGDVSKLQEIKGAILQMRAPLSLTTELKTKMKSARMPWPGDESKQRWNNAWQAIKKVWASKWNERAYLSCRKVKLNHEDLRMAVLVQEVICGDYAFVIHTKNPLSGDTSEIYAEIVKGLGETLVGAYPGRAMSFTAKKNNLRCPIVTGYPSKQIGLYCRPSIIFRSDSNGEDLEGYAGAGLYDSVLMDEEERVVLDYSRDPMIVDKAFQISLFSKIAEAGKIIETLYGCPQDIEGVVKDGVIYVVQARPQI